VQINPLEINSSVLDDPTNLPESCLNRASPVNRPLL